MRLAGVSLGKLSAIGILIGLGLYFQNLVGLLLLVIGTDLAMCRRPLAPRPVCWPALCVTGIGMLLVDPAIAFVCGWLVEASWTLAPPKVTPARTGA